MFRRIYTARQFHVLCLQLDMQSSSLWIYRPGLVIDRKKLSPCLSHKSDRKQINYANANHVEQGGKSDELSVIQLIMFMALFCGCRLLGLLSNCDINGRRFLCSRRTARLQFAFLRSMPLFILSRLSYYFISAGRSYNVV